MNLHPGVAALALSIGAFAAPALAAQDCYVARGTAAEATARPSPLTVAKADVEGKSVWVCYGAPSAKGRTMIGGEAAPFGTPWRMGANEATSIHLPFPAEIAGVRVEPGVYSLWAVPGESQWEIHVNRSVERWGIPLDESVRGADVGHGMAPARTSADHTETLTFILEAHGGGHAELVMSWEHTQVRIPIHGVM